MALQPHYKIVTGLLSHVNKRLGCKPPSERPHRDGRLSLLHLTVDCCSTCGFTASAVVTYFVQTEGRLVQYINNNVRAASSISTLTSFQLCMCVIISKFLDSKPKLIDLGLKFDGSKEEVWIQQFCQFIAFCINGASACPGASLRF